MELEIFTLSDYAVDNNGKLTIVGTFDTLFAQALPYVHPNCAVTLRMRFANSEAGHHEFEIRSLDPKGKEIQKVNANLEVAPHPHNDFSGINMVMNMSQFKIEKAGKYAFEFYYDGEFRSGFNMNVIKIETGPKLLAAA